MPRSKSDIRAASGSRALPFRMHLVKAAALGKTDPQILDGDERCWISRNKSPLGGFPPSLTIWLFVSGLFWSKRQDLLLRYADLNHGLTMGTCVTLKPMLKWEESNLTEESKFPLAELWEPPAPKFPGIHLHRRNSNG